MKRILVIFYVLIQVSTGHAQFQINRSYTFPQNYSTPLYNCFFSKPVRTIDKGYLFSFNPFTPGICSYDAEFYTIKTDSEFVQQWSLLKFSKSVSLPSGGIITISNTADLDPLSQNIATIEKRTPSGQSFWRKSLSANYKLNDIIYHNNLVTMVGAYVILPPFGSVLDPSYIPYILQVDTSGNIVNQMTFGPNYGEFTSVTISSNNDYIIGGNSGGPVLSRFSSNFTNSWAVYLNGPVYGRIYMRDAKVLQNGTILAFGYSTGLGNNSNACNATIFKLSQWGTLIKQLVINRSVWGGGICQADSNSFAFTTSNFSRDSVFLFECDDNLTLTTYRYLGPGAGIGTPVKDQGSLFVPSFRSAPNIRGYDLLGQGCESIPVTPNTSTVCASISMNWLSPVPGTVSLTNITPSPTYAMVQADTCLCQPVSTTRTAGCTNSNMNIQCSAFGPVSWFSQASGGTVLSSQNIYTHLPQSTGTGTFYAQSMYCPSFPRTPVVFTVNPSPLVAAAINPSVICIGTSATLTASGASTYSWSWGTSGSVVTTPVINSYFSATVTGKNQFGCASVYQVTANVIPAPTIQVTGPGTAICQGDSVQIIASGASSYTWNTGQTGDTLSIIPPAASFTVTGTAQNGCKSSSSVNLTVVPKPQLAAFVHDLSLCYGYPQTLIAYGAGTYTWSNGFVGQQCTTPPVFAPQVYTVYAQWDPLCPASATVAIFPNPVFTISVAASRTNICQGDQIQLNASGAVRYQWTFGGYGATQSVTPGASTVITVYGYDANSCRSSASVALIASPCTGLEKEFHSQNIELYPNPARDKFTISGLHSDAEIRVYSLTYSMIYHGPLSEKLEIECSTWPRGLYIVESGDTRTKVVIE